MPVPYGGYTLDRSTGQLVDQNGELWPPGSDLGHGYAFDVGPGGWFIYNLANPFERYTLGQQGEIGAVVSKGGFTSVYSEVGQRAFERMSDPNAVYAISGDITMVGPSGNQYERSIDYASAAPMGGSVYTYVDEEGVRRWDAAVPGSFQYEQHQMLYPETFREATASEVVDYAVRGYILRNYHDIVEEEARNIDEDTLPPGTTAFSAALEMLASYELQNISRYKQLIFTPEQGALVYGP